MKILKLQHTMEGASALAELRNWMSTTNKVMPGAMIMKVEARGAVMAGVARLQLDDWTPIRMPLGRKNLNVIKGLPTQPCEDTQVRVQFTVSGEFEAAEQAE